MEASMTAQQFAEAFNFIVNQYASAPATKESTNHALDLAESLFTSPDEFWDHYFAPPADDPTRIKAEALLKKLGPDATFLDLRNVLEQEAEQGKTEHPTGAVVIAPCTTGNSTRTPAPRHQKQHSNISHTGEHGRNRNE